MENPIKLSLVIKSHLTDADYETDAFPVLAQKRVNFVKMLLDKYPDTNIKVSEDELNDLWKNFGKV
jgi:hypothetical protein